MHPEHLKVLIKVEGLQKSYGSIKAVNDISVEVYEGEIFGMVGPNGAGKTTVIECIEGLRKPDKGFIQVLNLNPLTDKYKLKEKLEFSYKSHNFNNELE